MKKKLPKLPRGEGSFFEHRDKIGYRKTFTLPSGEKIKKTVYADTVNDCMTKMKIQERQIEENVIISKELLSNALYKWIYTYKKPVLKIQSYERLERTIKNQIENSYLGKMKYQSITNDNIQDYLNDLNEEGFSLSIIEKCYFILNGFYTYASIKDNFQNPMLLVTKPKKQNINKNEKEVTWLEHDDIIKFINECTKKAKSSGNYKHYNGLLYAANIFLGLRIGEYLALQWKDIDFENKTIRVNKTCIFYKNPNYNPNDKNSNKYIADIQTSTKTSYARIVPINSQAEQLLLEYKRISYHTKNNDYVLTTKNGNHIDVSSINTALRRIQKNANITDKNISSHVLRHTCASLLFKNNIKVEIIAKILGHSPEVCRKIYIGLAQEDIQTSIDTIDIDINIEN